MRRAILTGAFGASILVASAASGQIDPASLQPILVDKTTQTEDVRLTNEAERMTVPVRLSGVGPFRFLVDTGADRTAISREVAERLKLVPDSTASLHTAVGVSTVATTDVPNLQVSRKAVKIDGAPLLEARHMGADGILGVDSLKSQRVQFDFETNVMSIVPSATREYQDDPDAIVVVGRRKFGRLIFTDARVNGRDVTVVLDTGASVSIANSALRQMLRGRGIDDPRQSVQLLSVTGASLQGDYTFVRELEMGGVTINNLAVVFADAHTFKKLGIADRPALLLGMNAFRAFKKVSIDFATRKFKVVIPEESALQARFASGSGDPGRSF